MLINFSTNTSTLAHTSLTSQQTFLTKNPIERKKRKKAMKNRKRKSCNKQKKS